MPNYRCILFDLDGTLTDSGEGIVNSVVYALNKKGISVEDRQSLFSFVGPPLTDSFEKYCGMTEAEALASVEHYREYFREKGWQENAVYEGIPQVLKELKAAGKTLVVATSKPEGFSKRIVEHFGLAPYFDLVVGSTMDGSICRKDQVIALALSQLEGFKKEEIVMVGDREHDVLGAKKNGLPCVGVLYGYGSREELESAGAAAICPEVGMLLEYVGQ